MSSHILDKEHAMAAITDRLALAIQGVAAGQLRTRPPIP